MDQRDWLCCDERLERGPSDKKLKTLERLARMRKAKAAASETIPLGHATRRLALRRAFQPLLDAVQARDSTMDIYDMKGRLARIFDWWFDKIGIHASKPAQGTSAIASKSFDGTTWEGLFQCVLDTVETQGDYLGLVTDTESMRRKLKRLFDWWLVQVKSAASIMPPAAPAPKEDLALQIEKLQMQLAMKDAKLQASSEWFMQAVKSVEALTRRIFAPSSLTTGGCRVTTEGRSIQRTCRGP